MAKQLHVNIVAAFEMVVLKRLKFTKNSNHAPIKSFECLFFLLNTLVDAAWTESQHPSVVFMDDISCYGQSYA